jgi:Xaa-Pro dipeptidase
MKRTKGSYEIVTSERGSYGYFTRSEHMLRIDQARKLMQDKGVDGLLVSRKENVTYFTGSLWSSAGGLFAFLPVRDDPVVFVPFLEYGNALNTSWVDRLAPWSSYADPQSAEVFPPSSFEAIREVVENEVGTHAKIGLDMATMSHVDLSGISLALRGAELIDLSEPIAEILMIKSDEEIERIRKACEATCKGIRAGFESIGVGTTEREVARIALGTIVEETGFIPKFILVRSGPERSWMFNCVPSSKKIQRGDMVVIDAGGTYEDYPADVMRTGCVGEPTEIQKKKFEAEYAAQRTAVEAVKPGIRACDLYEVADKVLKEHNVADGSYPKTMGHGLGLGGYGPPLLTPAVKTELRQNMVLAVEPNMLDKPFTFTATPRHMDFAVEDNVRVTEGGHEILTPLQRELWILG